MCHSCAHTDRLSHFDQNDQNLNFKSLLWDQGRKNNCCVYHNILNGRDFKGIKCVGLKELFSAGLKLIGLISDLLTSYGYRSWRSTHQNFKLPGTCLYPSPVPLLNNITLTVQTVWLPYKWTKPLSGWRLAGWLKWSTIPLMHSVVW